MKIALLYTPSDKHLAALRLVAGAAELAIAGDSLDETVQAITGALRVLKPWCPTRTRSSSSSSGPAPDPAWSGRPCTSPRAAPP